ncbi:MAG: FHA domain-containing protein [Acidobacteriota bacterium]
MKEFVENIKKIADKILKIYELKKNYPPSVSERIINEYLINLKEISDSIPIDKKYINEEISKMKERISTLKKEIEEREISLRTTEIKFDIGEYKEDQKNKLLNLYKSEIKRLKEEEKSLLNKVKRYEFFSEISREISIFPESLKTQTSSPEDIISAEQELEILEKEPESIEFQETGATELEEQPIKFEEELQIELEKPEPGEKKEELFEAPEFLSQEEKIERKTTGEVEKTVFVTRPFLVVIENDEEKKYILNEQKTVVGRSPDCDITLRGKGVSREHFCIIQENEDFIIEDLESKNGTLVNGKKIKRETLRNNDRIEAGESTIIFKV